MLPFITFGQIAEIVDQEQNCKNIVKSIVKTISLLINVVSILVIMSLLLFMIYFVTACVRQGCIYGLLKLCLCHCFLSCVYREKLRTKFGLPAEPCNDCCVHFLLWEMCSLSRACWAENKRLWSIARLFPQLFPLYIFIYLF